jgi:NhaA family Na+:H+ antiporter
MNENRQADAEIACLPRELVDRLTKPFVEFLRIETAAGAVLLSFADAAVVLSNSSWAYPFFDVWESRVGLHIGSLEFARSLRDWINDGLTTLFFFWSP